MSKRHIVFAFTAVAIFVVGTLIGRAAQEPRPDFTIELTMTTGLGMKATCVQGCQFIDSKPLDGGELRRSIELKDTVTYPCPSGCKTLAQGTIVRPQGKGTN